MNHFDLSIPEATPALVAMIERADARNTSEADSATDNAISAVAKILKYNSSMVNANEVGQDMESTLF